MRIAVGSRTDTGRVRSDNEDSLLIDGPLFGVADGMGGHLAGDVASATAVEVIGGLARHHPPTDQRTLASFIEEANTAIYDKASTDPQMSGMGTTCTLLYLEGGTAHIAHVGDSRAYLMRDGELSQITQDHTLVERMVQEGRLKREEAAHHPQRSVITRALGIDPRVQVDTFDIELRDGDRVLLCSDGLSSMIDDGTIHTVLSETPDVQAAANRLVDAANEAGGEDNISVLVIGAGEDAPATSPPPPVMREDTLPGAQDRSAPERGSTWRRRLTIVVVVVVVLLAAGYGAARWALGRAYFVGATDSGMVAIYTGIPDTVAGISLREEQEVTDISVDDLPENLRDNVESGIKVDGLDEAESTVADLQERADEFGATGDGTGTGGKNKGSN